MGYWGSLVIAQVGEKASTFASKREFSVGKIVDDFAKDDDGNGWFESFHVYDEVRLMLDFKLFDSLHRWKIVLLVSNTS